MPEEGSAGKDPGTGRIPLRVKPAGRAWKRYVFKGSILLLAAALAYYFSIIPTPTLLQPLITYYTILTLVVILFYDQIREFALRFRRSGVVICGLGDTGSTLAKNFSDAGMPVAAIEKDSKNPEIEICKARGIVVIGGDALDWETLERARPWQAKYLFAVTGENGTNGEIAIRLYEVVRKRATGPVTCFVHLTDSALCSLLKARQVGTIDSTPFRLEFFNTYQTAARLLYRAHPPFPASAPSPPSAHMLVVGLGRMGESLVAHAVRDWKETYGTTGKRLKITILDRDAEQKKEALLLRSRTLASASECQALSLDLHSPDFLRTLSRIMENTAGHPTSVYICLSDESLGLSSALEIHRSLHLTTVPIVIRTRHSSGLIDLVGALDGGEGLYQNLHAFPVVDRTCTLGLVLESTHEQIARAIHGHYLQMQQQWGVVPGDNPVLVPWEALPEEYREANRRQADHITKTLHRIGCDISLLGDWDEEPFSFAPEELEILAAGEHERWSREKLASAWTFGAVRDEGSRRHPSLVPWDQLSEAEKEKDRNAVRVLPAVLARVDLKIIRAAPPLTRG